MSPGDRMYTKQHEWVQIDGGTGTVGITDFAQSELGDVVYVDLPLPGTKFQAGQPLGTVESVKAVSEIFCPVSGEITEVNGSLHESPETLNADPYGKGWLVRIRMEGNAENALITAQEYDAHTGKG